MVSTAQYNALVDRVKNLETWKAALVADMAKQNLVARVTKLEGGSVPIPTPTPTPVPTPTPTPVPTPTPTPVPSGASWPANASDPRFGTLTPSSEIRGPGTYSHMKVLSTGQAGIYQGPYTVSNSVFLGREGPRIDTGNINITDCYIEIQGVSPDHGDGMQAYNPGGSSVVVIKRTHIKMLPNDKEGNNCGFFLADDSNVDLTLEDVCIEDVNSPNGAIWMPNRPGDTGVRKISFKNVVIKGCTRGVCGIDYSGSGAVKPTIVLWDNVTSDGVQVPRPY